MSNLSDESNKHVFWRARKNLRWYRALNLILLFFAWFVYGYLNNNAGLQVWLIFARPLIAACLLVFVVLENLILNLSSPATPVPYEKSPEPRFAQRYWRKLQSPGIKASLTYVYQHILTAVCSVLAIYMLVTNFSNTVLLTPITTGIIPVICILLAACFSVLVGERMLSFKPIRQWPLHSMLT